jgi:hypothetical protein
MRVGLKTLTRDILRPVAGEKELEVAGVESNAENIRDAKAASA